MAVRHSTLPEPAAFIKRVVTVCRGGKSTETHNGSRWPASSRGRQLRTTCHGTAFSARFPTTKIDSLPVLAFRSTAKMLPHVLAPFRARITCKARLDFARLTSCPHVLAPCRHAQNLCPKYERDFEISPPTSTRHGCFETSVSPSC